MPKMKENWWHTDDKGRRIGWMSPEDFDIWIGRMFPKGFAPRVQFADAMGMDVSKVCRWGTGSDPIPKWVAQMHALHARQATPNAFGEPEAAWLPVTTSANGRREAPAHMRAERDPRGRQRG